MLITIMAALAQMGFTDRHIGNTLHSINGVEATAQVFRDLGMSRSTFYRRAQTLKF
jgi:DNA-binding phage protein